MSDLSALEDYLKASFREQTGNGHDPAPLGPEPDRNALTVAAWIKRQLPPRDFLFDGALSTICRWLVVGQTGVGKTLFALELGFAVAAGANFLNWKGGGRGRRVMYFDGELPAETMKERIEIGHSRHGSDLEMVVYNRDLLRPQEMPPFNTPEGQAWLWREIEAVAPDLIIFDSVMCLTCGPMVEEESWSPMTPLIQRISSHRIAQIWLDHTGHNSGRSYGTKTKEWGMDAVILLSMPDADADEIKLDFSKKRLCKPETAHLFQPVLIKRAGWSSTAAPSQARGNSGQTTRQWFLEALDELAEDAGLEPGHTAAPVRKVALDRIRDRMKSLGQLDTEDGKLIPQARTAFHRARKELLAAKTLASDGKAAWRIGK
jgi:hypothetical protein